MLIVVGSDNPCKRKAVIKVFTKVWPKARIKSLTVTSGVASQPMGEKKIIQGAVNRAQKAVKAHQADFGVGIEGGIRKVQNSWFTTAWCAIIDKKGRQSLGGGLMMPLGEPVMKKVLAGQELGEVIDELTGSVDVKKKMGATGVLTKGLVDRTRAYEVIVAYALTQFLHPKKYKNLLYSH